VLAGFSTAASAMVMVIEYACCDASRVYRSTVRDGNREWSGAGDVVEAVLVGRNVNEAHGRRDRPSETLTPTSRGADDHLREVQTTPRSITTSSQY
jgi:hypothetical protein